MRPRRGSVPDIHHNARALAARQPAFRGRRTKVIAWHEQARSDDPAINIRQRQQQRWPRLWPARVVAEAGRDPQCAGTSAFGRTSRSTRVNASARATRAASSAGRCRAWTSARAQCASAASRARSANTICNSSSADKPTIAATGRQRVDGTGASSEGARTKLGVRLRRPRWMAPPRPPLRLVRGRRRRRCTACGETATWSIGFPVAGTCSGSSAACAETAAVAVRCHRRAAGRRRLQQRFTTRTSRWRLALAGSSATRNWQCGQRTNMRVIQQRPLAGASINRDNGRRCGSSRPRARRGDRRTNVRSAPAARPPGRRGCRTRRCAPPPATRAASVSARRSSAEARMLATTTR